MTTFPDLQQIINNRWVKPFLGSKPIDDSGPSMIRVVSVDVSYPSTWADAESSICINGNQRSGEEAQGWKRWRFQRPLAPVLTISRREEPRDSSPRTGSRSITPVWSGKSPGYYRDGRLTFAILASPVPSRDPNRSPPYSVLQWCISSAHLGYIEDWWLKLTVDCRLVEFQAPLPIEKLKSYHSYVLLSKRFSGFIHPWGPLPCTQRSSTEKWLWFGQNTLSTYNAASRGHYLWPFPTWRLWCRQVTQIKIRTPIGNWPASPGFSMWALHETSPYLARIAISLSQKDGLPIGRPFKATRQRISHSESVQVLRPV